MKYVYAVTVQPIPYTWEKISQECYLSLKAAQDFIENRGDKPVKFDDFRYQGTTNVYRIYELQVKE